MTSDPAGLAERVLGHRFHRPELLAQALTRSAPDKGRGDARQWRTYQRLEFLGDRVLGLAVAHLLYNRFANEDEGALARRHSALVCREALVRVAEKIDLAQFMPLLASEAEAGGRGNPGIVADTLEAVIAALYLDGGLKAADAFVQRHWTPLMDEETTPPQDAKTALQEWAQSRGKPLPAYREVDRIGPDHAPTFTIELTVDGLPPATASGPSKRIAEQDAASVLLEQLKRSSQGV